MTEIQTLPVAEEINVSDESPPVSQADIDRFHERGGAQLLTLRERHEEVPVCSIENGLERDLHLDWAAYGTSAFLSVRPGCENATLTVISHGTKTPAEKSEHSLTDSDWTEQIESRLVKAFNQ